MIRPRLKQLASKLEGPIGVLALLIVPALLLEERATSPELHTLAVYLNWVVWLAFCFEFLVVIGAEPGWATVRKSLFNLVLIVITPPFLVPDYLQATRSLRVIRLVRIVRIARAGIVAAIGLKLARKIFVHRQF